MSLWVYQTSCTSKTCPPLPYHPPISAASAYSSSSYIPCPSFSLPCLSQTAFSQSYFLHLSSCLFPRYQGPKLLIHSRVPLPSPLLLEQPPSSIRNPAHNPPILSLLYPSPFTPPHPLPYPTSSWNIFHYSRPILLHTTLCPLGPPSSHLIQLSVIWTHINLWSDGKSMPSQSSTLIWRWNIPDIRPSPIAECAVLLIRSPHFSTIVTYIWLHP